MYRFLLILIFLSACSDDDQKSYSKLESLRVLAIVADTPEINGPQTVNLSPYVSYVNGGDTTLDVTYEACPDPGIAFGADANCGLTPPGPNLISGSLSFPTSAIGSSEAYTGFVTSIAIPVPPELFALLSTFDDQRKFNGLDMVVFMTITDQNNPEAKVNSLKRIRLTEKTSGLNSNPTIVGDFQGNGATLAAFPAKPTEMGLQGLSAPETYDFQTTKGQITALKEQMTISWFSNVGSFKFDRTDPEKTSEYDPETETNGFFVGVYRDNRGGVTVIKKSFP